MAVEVSTLVKPLQRAVNPPGQDLFASTAGSEWRGRLMDAFWKARVNQFFIGYSIDVDAETIVNTSGGPDLPREDQQLIVMFAAFQAVQQRLGNLPTMSRAQVAGGTETETQRSATLLTQLLKDMRDELEEVKVTLRGVTRPRAVAFIDSFLIASERFMNPGFGESVGWVRS